MPTKHFPHISCLCKSTKFSLKSPLQFSNKFINFLPYALWLGKLLTAYSIDIISEQSVFSRIFAQFLQHFVVLVGFLVVISYRTAATTSSCKWWPRIFNGLSCGASQSTPPPLPLPLHALKRRGKSGKRFSRSLGKKRIKTGGDCPQLRHATREKERERERGSTALR